MEKQGMAVTVLRQMGSGGTYIGYEVAKALGFSYVDREILRRAASLLKRDAASLEEREGRSSGFIENFLRTFTYATPETYAPTEPPVYDRDLFILESKIIREIVHEHNGVIMGRGGFFVLKDRPKTIHLFIHGPRDYRIKRMMKADSTAGLRKAQERVDEVGSHEDQVHTGYGRNRMDGRTKLSSLCRLSMAGLSEILGIVIGFARTALG